MKRAFTLLEALIVVGIIALIAAFLFPVFARYNEPRGGRRSSCMSNLKQIGLGMMQYLQDYNETYPLAHQTTSTGWADLLQPYVKSTQLFQCPSAQGKSANFSTDYFYNRRLSRVTMNQVLESPLTVMFGDGDDDALTWNSWNVMPTDAATNSNSPSQRHQQKANYCFADGHVKTLAPDVISSTFASPSSKFTFAFR